MAGDFDVSDEDAALDALKTDIRIELDRPADAPFVQITAAPGPRIFALDSAGVVWEYSETYMGWLKKHEARKQL